MAIKAELTSRDRRFLDMSLNAPMWKVILYIGTPLALYQGLAAIFTILDTLMASHISKESVSAVAYLAQINLLLSSVGGGLAVGAGIQISRAYLRLAGTPDELIAVGREYFTIQLFVMVVNFLNSVYISVERARGNARRIFILNIAMILVKLGLTAYFVYVLESGLNMIAVASLVSELTMFVFAVRYSLFGDNAFSFSPKAVSFNRRVTTPMVRQSLPVIAEKALFAFGKTIVNSMCTLYGPLMVGAMGVSNNLGGITTNPQNGYEQGSASIISQNFGAGRFRRVLEAFYVTAAINMLIGAVISGLELWQLDFLSGLFDGGSEDFRRMIAMVYRYEALGAVPLGFNAAVMALLYGLGKTQLTLVLNFSRVFIFRIPVFWFLQHCTEVGEKSVGIVMMVSNVSVAVAAGLAAVFVIRRFQREFPVSSS